jgi:ribosomal protein S18 acetylase RimI-like enzyme
MPHRGTPQPTTDPEQAVARRYALVSAQVEGHHAWYRTFASAGSELARFGSAQAVLTLARPERSLVNAVVYSDPDDVPLDELAAFFAPVQAWCVWVQPGHDGLADACAARGMTIDATPMLMAAPLDEVDLRAREVPAEIGVGSWEEMGAINDAAYGLPPEHFAPVMRHLPTGGYRLTVARRAGESIACAGVVVAQRNAEVVFVATLPEARRQGLAAECMRAALRTAAQDGCSTTTLEATAAGEPVYAAMGYRSFGRYRMLEARPGSP